MLFPKVCSSEHQSWSELSWLQVFAQLVDRHIGPDRSSLRLGQTAVGVKMTHISFEMDKPHFTEFYRNPVYVIYVY